MTDAQLLKDLRKKLDLTQQELANLLGYKEVQSIARIEQGRGDLSGQAKAHIQTITDNLESIKHQLTDRTQ